MHLLVGLAVALQVGAASGIRVRIETPLGNIEAVVDSAKAPRTAANFLAYVDAHAYDNARFHRTVRADNQPNDSVRIGVIQARLDSAHRAQFRRPPIELERTSVTGLQHVDGTLSMARAGPDTATSEFVICIGDQPALDFGGHRNLDGQGLCGLWQGDERAGRCEVDSGVSRGGAATHAANHYHSHRSALITCRGLYA